MTIDVQTIALLIIVSTVLTAVLVFAYTRKHHDSRSNFVFLAAKLTQALAWPLILLRGQIPDFLSILFGNYLLMLAVSLEGWALISLKRPFKGWVVTAYVILLAAQYLAVTTVFIWFNSEPARVFVFSLGSALVMVGPVVAFIRHKLKTALEWLFVVIYAIVVLFFAFRAVNALAGFIVAGINENHWYNALAYTLVFGQTIVVNAGFILLTKEKDDAILRTAATIDQLTNISNRHTFLEESNKCIAKARDDKQPVSMLMFDIDNFKYVNDEFGHMVGDQALTEIAALVKRIMEGCQMVGRFGGDEFAVLLLGSDEAASDEKSRQIIEIIKNYRFTTKQVELAVSIGVVTIVPTAETTFDTFYRLADLGLYQAKKVTKSAFSRVQP